MEERVVGWVGSGASAGRRRRLRAMLRGYPMSRMLAVGLALAAWLVTLAPALADSHSRYSAPLWTWIAAIIVAIGLSLAGLLVGWWFLRKKSRMESPE